MNKIEKIFLILGITAAAPILILLLVDDRMLGFVVVTGVFVLTLLIVDPLDSKSKKEDEKKWKLRHSELKLKQLSTPESMNVLLYFSVYHLSLFLEALEANMRVYSPSNTKEKQWLYSTTGSALFQLRIDLLFVENGIWGKKLGIQGNAVVEDRGENLSSELVFEKTSFITKK